MNKITITNDIKYLGADDKDIDLFESQYVVPNGVSYNSYLILDEHITVMDTVDERVTDAWFNNLERELNGKLPEYLVVSHLEPDHASNIQRFVEKYPNAKIIGNAKTFAMMPQFFDIDLTNKQVTVKEGDTISLGKHTLQFFMAPMVHWPEVMVTYEQSQKILFSADGFGKFGTLDTDEDWISEARRYYINIVGKYGAPVQALLKKAATLDINMICPLHGPVLKENLGYYIDKYNTWSLYEPEDEGILIAYASIHGNTRKVANKLAEMLRDKGHKNVIVTDLSRDDMATAVENAFRYSKLVVAGASYDGTVFPCMEDFLLHLKNKNFQKRTIGIIENGSWAPCAAKAMKEIISNMKNINICETVVTIKSTLKNDSMSSLEKLATEL